jgi:hypothetical protein
MTRDAGEAHVKDHEAHDDEDLVEPLEQLEGFVETGEVRTNARALLRQDDQGGGLRL